MVANRADGEKEKEKEGDVTSCQCGTFCRRYFWEGQLLSEDAALLQQDVPPSPLVSRVSAFVSKYRRPVAMVIPAVFFYVSWLTLATKHDFWQLFPRHYAMSLTMVVGSMIAGMTSEGGGAVAFPIMTLALHIDPSVARDFSLMIQSCGMTAASFTIWFMGVQVEPHAILLCSLGGGVGVALGLSFIDPLLSAAEKKIIFASVWFSFAFALFLLNRNVGRRTFLTIPAFSGWKAGVLVGTGVLGGLFTSIAGSGLDITCFSVLTLLFRVTEKTATPTSVVLMAINTCVGFFWRQWVQMTVTDEAWEYLAVCVPVVVVGAPLGSLLGSHFHRLVLASFVYVLDTVALVSSLIIVPMTPILWGMAAGLLTLGLLFFLLLTHLGKKLLGSSDHTPLSLSGYDPMSESSE